MGLEPCRGFFWKCLGFAVAGEGWGLPQPCGFGFAKIWGFVSGICSKPCLMDFGGRLLTPVYGDLLTT